MMKQRRYLDKMKFGGVSWNKSLNHKQGVKTKFRCKYCNREYKMDWAKNNHERICREHQDEQD